MNEPQFKIYGKERKRLKKELSKLKSFLKSFWNYHQLDKDMCSIYGCTDNYLMNDENAQRKYNETNIKIINLEQQLNEK